LQFSKKWLTLQPKKRINRLNFVANIFEIIENRQIAAATWKMVLQGDISAFSAAGQFVNIALPDKFLRRPISVCDIDFANSAVTLIYKIAGAGTLQMSRLKKNDKLDLLTGLGNGFNIETEIKKPLIVGGGAGCPPLYYLAKCLIKRNLQPKIVLGFNTKEEIFLQKDFEQLGLQVFVATTDGSVGTKGFVTDAISKNNIDFDYYFACGPMPMLKALCNTLKIGGQLSFEERMGCGFGGCMGCSCKTKNGIKRICKEGPVLTNEEILFE
jgi:dihydroorotate dehydrogenase electron transfer subunit